MSWNPLTWFSSAPAGAGPEWDDVKKEIEEILEDNADNGPFFVRLAWHCAGSFDAASGTGGSDGATMRFAPEADHGGNAGLGLARDLLEVRLSSLRLIASASSSICCSHPLCGLCVSWMIDSTVECTCVVICNATCRTHARMSHSLTVLIHFHLR
jgi:hypothetical protein